LQELFSKLNPMAAEFVPHSLSNNNSFGTVNGLNGVNEGFYGSNSSNNLVVNGNGFDRNGQVNGNAARRVKNDYLFSWLIKYFYHKLQERKKIKGILNAFLVLCFFGLIELTRFSWTRTDLVLKKMKLCGSNACFMLVFICLDSFSGCLN